MKRREFISLISGAAATWPLVVHTQQPVLPIVGLLRSNTEAPEYIAAFRRGLSDSGYTDGTNITVDIRVAEGKRDRLSEFAADLVRHHRSVGRKQAGDMIRMHMRDHNGIDRARVDASGSEVLR